MSKILTKYEKVQKKNQEIPKKSGKVQNVQSSEKSGKVKMFEKLWESPKKQRSIEKSIKKYGSPKKSGNVQKSPIKSGKEQKRTKKYKKVRKSQKQLKKLCECAKKSKILSTNFWDFSTVSDLNKVFYFPRLLCNFTYFSDCFHTLSDFLDFNTSFSDFFGLFTFHLTFPSVLHCFDFF